MLYKMAGDQCIRWERIWYMGSYKYRALNSCTYVSNRYNKKVTVPEGFLSDGASGPAKDIGTDAWGFHDKLARTWKWDDGTPVTKWQASNVLGDILKRDGYWLRAIYWKYATFLF